MIEKLRVVFSGIPFAHRIAVGAAALSLAVVLAIGFSSYFVIKDLIKENITADLQHQADQKARDLTTLLKSLDANLDNLAKNTLVGNALADNLGRSTYLRPFLDGFKEFQGIPLHIHITDFRGISLEHAYKMNGETPLYPWLAGAIDKAEHQAHIIEKKDGPVLIHMAPVIYVNTGLAEGSLVYEVRLADILKTVEFAAEDKRRAYLTYNLNGQENGTLNPDFLSVREQGLTIHSPIDLKHPLNAFGLAMHLAVDKAVLDRPLRQLGSDLAGIGLVSFFLVWVVSQYMGRRLTRSLTELTHAVEATDFNNLEALDVVSQGSDEVGRLGDAFAHMTDRLSQAYRDLEKQGQILLRNAERIAHLGSWSLDLENQTVRWSDEMFDVLNLPHNIQPGWRPFFRLISPQDRQRFREAMKDTLRDGKNLNLDVLIETDTHAPRILHIQGELGASKKWFNGTVQDISEQKAMEEKLEMAVDELKRSNAELEQFAYVASHDLRQPIRMIGSYVALLERQYGEKLDENALEYIGFAKDGAKRMDQLVLDLLQYSRVGRRGAEFSAVEMQEVLDLAIDNLELAIEDCNADVSVKGRLPKVMGKATELIRLIQNLVGNALKYSPKDRDPIIKVEVKHDAGYWTFSIQDNGIGIEDEFQERVFGIFQRLHTPDEYEGTGIGLAVCKKIVERHGGEIWFESESGKGTTFFFTLPHIDKGHR